MKFKCGDKVRIKSEYIGILAYHYKMGNTATCIDGCLFKMYDGNTQLCIDLKDTTKVFEIYEEREWDL